MTGEDDEKTVFGGPLAGGASPRGPGADPWGPPPVGQRAPIPPVPPARPGTSPASASPFGDGGQGASPFGAGTGQTWLGRPGQPAPLPGQIGRAAGADRGFFPDLAAPAPPPSRPSSRIPLAEALQVRDLGAGASSNPMLAAAAGLLILLGRLRTGMVDLDVAPLMEHVTREIDRFERNALAAGVHPHQALVAKYALSGTADDIVQNLPGSDRGSWQQYSMVARFFHKRDSGVGFFQEAEKAMQAPAQHYNLLELMLVCMSLGFEGQFRTQPNGAAELARIRGAIYESLRRVNPRPDEDISVMWTPVVQDRGRRFAAIPLPAVLGVGLAIVVGAFATFATLINRDGAAAAEEMRAIYRGAPALQIDRTDPGPAFVAQIPQLDRLRAAFAGEIEAGLVGVEAKGDYIAIRVGNLQLFDLGAVEVRPAFADLAARIAEVLNAEPGPILVEGHTDNVPLTGRGQFKDNYQLSTARAEGVAEVLAPRLADPARLRVEGRGEDDPVADNATEEGRAANRRVEVLLAREGSFEPPAGAASGAAPGGEEQTETAN